MTNGAALSRTERVGGTDVDRQLVGLIGLAASQIEVALREAEAPVAALGELISGLADRDSAHAGAAALQYHDRLAQRLTHVRDTLSALVEFLLDSAGERGPAADWDRLRAGIRSRYSMEPERLMFDLLLRGASPDEVLKALAELKVNGAASHVDLF
jgi:hypothetical protein